MKYTLMTGATGLLGGYLLRDGLMAGRRFAVIVRPSRVESAQQRIESQLARFEESLSHVLPRPVVIEGNLCEPSAGLNPSALRWVRENCDQVLHNAASLSFYHDEKTGEPERSNIEGTKNVLELCRETGLRKFHHVSTAYVCGLRKGLCLESELDVDQEFGNDYESSKVKAETLVRSSSFLDQTTFYRPAIIIGDSQTGFTSSFHGFFTPLKVASAFLGSSLAPGLNGPEILRSLGFSPEDEKNYVPVDWVSAVTTHLLGSAEHHGQTYHLVPRNRVSMKTNTRVLVDAIDRCQENYDPPEKGEAIGLQAGLSMFREQMEVYKAYWRDDPEFDYRNTSAAAPHLPCPTIDYDMLMKMSMFALESRFGWPIPQPVLAKWDLQRCFETMSGTSDEASKESDTIGLQANGPGGGQWSLTVKQGEVHQTSPGLPTDASPVMYMNTRSYNRLLSPSAIQQGAVHIEFNGAPTAPHEAMIESVLRWISTSSASQQALSL